jgi:thymidylate synthase
VAIFPYSQYHERSEGVMVGYRNAAIAFIGELERIRTAGRPVVVRGAATTELLAKTIQIDHPTERFITLPGRRNDPFAAIAESMWVIAGRDDVGYLQRYLPRAPNYSDDGAHWRGAYGPRLRAWGNTDQFDEVRRLLRDDPLTRRAVMSIFDPGRDFVETRDVPCNNWLHFIQRDGRLDLNVVIRSNDIIWGFSGINTFEWSLLHEMMALWVGAEVGVATFFISSLHYYDDRIAQVDRTLGQFRGLTGYEDGWNAARFTTDWDELPGLLDEWFTLEARLAAGTAPDADIDDFPDPLLRSFLQAIRVKWAADTGADEASLRGMVDDLGISDVAFALREFLFRDSAALLRGEAASHPGHNLRSAVADLHRSKDASYGNAWKRRGEQVSVLANIARKVDRLENVVAGAPAGTESLLDTVVDLVVYALKYETFLADQDATVARLVFGAEARGPFSDGPAGFDTLIDVRSFDSPYSSVPEEAATVVDRFAELDVLVREQSPSALQKAESARQLSDASLRLLRSLAEKSPDPIATIRREIG